MSYFLPKNRYWGELLPLLYLTFTAHVWPSSVFFKTQKVYILYTGYKAHDCSILARFPKISHKFFSVSSFQKNRVSLFWPWATMFTTTWDDWTNKVLFTPNLVSLCKSLVFNTGRREKCTVGCSYSFCTSLSWFWRYNWA